ncbi:MAG: hypothetical protein WA874_04225, partial [Chryseosolibacter sp.]
SVLVDGRQTTVLGKSAPSHHPFTLPVYLFTFQTSQRKKLKVNFTEPEPAYLFAHLPLESVSVSALRGRLLPFFQSDL